MFLENKTINCQKNSLLLFLLSFALKKLRLTIKNKEEFLQSKKIRECNILLQMRPSNDHVVRYVDSFFDHLDHFYLITEYCDVFEIDNF
jgi:hypothetical protein